MSARTLSLLSAGLILALGLTACSSRYDLAPPPGGPQVSVTIQAPEGASVKAIEAQYLSDHCFPPQRGPFNSYGSEVLEVKPERQGDSDLYQARLDLDGGSICQWRLVYVKVGVKYWRAGKLDLAGTVRQDVTATFHVDRKIGGDERLAEPARTRTEVLLNPVYYPYVTGGDSGNALIRFIDSGATYARAPAAERLVFEPQVQRHLVARMSQAANGKATILYPDGSTLPADSWEPDVKKLDAIRTGADKRN